MVIHAHDSQFFPIPKNALDSFFDGCEKWELEISGIEDEAVNEFIECALWMEEVKKSDEEKYVPFFPALGTHESFIMEF